MVSKNQLKLITSLQQKKYRMAHGLFVAEGVKVVNELLTEDLQIEKLYCVEAYAAQLKEYDPQIISEKELQKISQLSSPNKVLGLFRIPSSKSPLKKGLILALDSINDPGNLGTMIRLADWFGVSQIVCSESTVDCYNSKVVQATMGSLARIPIFYGSLGSFLSETDLPIYGAVMQGENLYHSELHQDAILVMGNESKGISLELESLLQHRITIPKYDANVSVESLNVATAAAIVLNEFRRH